jgi:type IV conjugative transfer system coupling protein TraD
MGLLKTVAAGGQTWAHRMRMIRQVVRIACVASLLSGFGFIGIRLFQEPKESYQSLCYYGKAVIAQFISDKVSVSSDFWAHVSPYAYSGEDVEVSSKELEAACEECFKDFLGRLLLWLKQAGLLSLSVFASFIMFFLIRGIGTKKNKHIKGRKMVSPGILSIKSRLSGKASVIKIGDLPLIRGTETQHILVSGGTGSGKTNSFHHILPQIRNSGQRAVIVDTTGVFVSKYYLEGKDVLLNPFDARGKPWHPWCECKDRFDYDSLAQSFIPISHADHENYWRNAARSVFSALLEKRQKDKKLSGLSKSLLRSTLSDLYKELKETRASSHLDPSTDKTAGSIRSVAASFLECLDYLRDTTDPFSIRDWVQGDSNDGSWLFLMASPSQRAVLVPLISAWYSIAMRSLMQMSIDLDRRMWFVADELPSLQKLKELETCLVEGRKFGACALLAIQSPAQLEMIYGHHNTRVIIGNCATKVSFFEQDPTIAKQISQIFGEREVEEHQEGISYGAHQMRDGVNVSSIKRVRPVVSASDIQSLNKNVAYIKLPGKTPVTKLKLRCLHPETIADSFVPLQMEMEN